MMMMIMMMKMMMMMMMPIHYAIETTSYLLPSLSSFYYFGRSRCNQLET